jgi:DNA-directed RNA polymerase subunit RPC12/RpoP
MDSWENIDLEDFHCPLCTYNNKMVTLGCNHKMCEECLKKMRKQSIHNKNGDGFRCPYCRVKIERDVVKAGW